MTDWFFPVVFSLYGLFGGWLGPGTGHGLWFAFLGQVGAFALGALVQQRLSRKERS